MVDKIDDKFVLIDGETRRRKCNVNHLHFLGKNVKLTKNVSTADVKALLKKEGFETTEKKKTKTKKEKTTKPLKQRKVKAKVSEEKKVETKQKKETTKKKVK